MNPDWQAFLSRHGASFNNTPRATFSSPYEGESKAHLFDLSWRSLIRVSGDDAQSFLHGQFSNDLHRLDGSNSQLSSYSTPKGRVLALFRIMRLGEDYYLDLPAELGDAFVKRLQMFVMRAKVVIESLAETHIGIGLSGEAAAGLLESAGLDVPPAVNACRESRSRDCIVCRVPGVVPRFVVFAPLTAAEALWDELAATAIPASTNFWILQQIDAGQPEIYSETRESFVAQMINLQLIDGVNFKKGCYPGQEVIARLQYLGKLKRRMYRLEADAAECSPATPVFAEGSDEPAGEIVDSALNPQGRLHVLAVLKSDLVTQDAGLHLGEPDGPALRRLDLPYSLDEEAQAD
ncbi:MAG: folate-binding protein YgfZ [Gammaproteobacteria bacterium]|nr:folate-binding protein YgfZ [Gammaproteobacteria bacterium]